MKYAASTGLFALLLVTPNLLQAQKVRELEFLFLHQYDNKEGRRLDLSGLVVVDEKIYMVGDKDYDSYIYEIEFTDRTFYIKDKITLYFDRVREFEEIRLDLEGIDACTGLFYLINETTNEVIEVRGEEIRRVEIQYEEFGEDPSSWLKNAGYEGIALDCANDILFLAKERQPRFVYEVDRGSGRIISKFNIPETESADFAAMEFDSGFLYLLERNGNYVTKVNAETKEVEEKVSYRHICSHPQGKLFEPSKYGMAEALWLTEDEIWVGIDNNGLKVSSFAQKEYGISGADPVIIRFKRPKDF